MSICNRFDNTTAEVAPGKCQIFVFILSSLWIRGVSSDTAEASHTKVVPKWFSDEVSDLT